MIYTVPASWHFSFPGMLQSFLKFSNKEKKTLVSLCKTPVFCLRGDLMITFCSSVKSVEFVDWTSFCNCLARLKKRRKKKKDRSVNALQSNLRGGSTVCVCAPWRSGKEWRQKLHFVLKLQFKEGMKSVFRADRIFKNVFRHWLYCLKAGNIPHWTHENPPLTMRGCGWLFLNPLRSISPFLHCRTHNETLHAAPKRWSATTGSEAGFPLNSKLPGWMNVGCNMHTATLLSSATTATSRHGWVGFVYCQ